MPISRSNWVCHSFVVLCTGLALLVSIALKPVLELNIFLPFSASVLVAVWIGGVSGGIVSTALSLVALRYFFLSPLYGLAITDHNDILRLIEFAAGALLVTVLAAGLRSSKGMLSATLSSIDDAVIASDLRGNITFINPSAEALTGWKQKDAKGKPFEAVVPLVDQVSGHLLEDLVSQVLRTPAPMKLPEGVLLMTRGGSHVPIDDSAAPIRDDRGVARGVIVVLRDIRERRLSEAKLRELTNTLRAVLCASPLAIWALDLKGNVVFWSQAAEKMFGWSELEVIERRLPVIPDEQETTFEHLLRDCTAGQQLSAIECTLVKKDRSPTETSIWMSPLRDSAGVICATVHVVADITDRHRLEEEVRQSHKLEAVGRLAGGIAHDFNNLLMIMNGHASMVLESLTLQGRTRSQVEEILNAGKRAAALTTRLLAFSRRQMLQPEIVDPNAIVSNIERMLRSVITEDIEFKGALDPNVGKVKADPNQVEQILINLAANARDAMPHGGSFTIETANEELLQSGFCHQIGVKPGSYVKLTVTDSGVGMDADTKSHIFEPFFTTKKKGKGTGLGLASVYGSVKQSQGGISFSTEPGKGTRFCIYLPRVQETTVSREVELNTGKVAQGGREKILLVEDEDAVRKMLRDALVKAGYRVCEASDGAEALRNWERQAPIDLVLTDLVMPMCTGVELAQRITHSCPSVKVIYMSGHSDEVIACHGVLGDDAVLLQKPFLPELLLARVRETLDPPEGPEQFLSCNNTLAARAGI